MTPVSLPSDACLATHLVTLLALPSVAFGRPFRAATQALAARTSHPDTMLQIVSMPAQFT